MTKYIFPLIAAALVGCDSKPKSTSTNPGDLRFPPVPTETLAPLISEFHNYTGNHEKTLEVFVGSHGYLTSGIEYAQSIDFGTKTKLEYLADAYFNRDITQINLEGMPNGKGFADSYTITFLGGIQKHSSNDEMADNHSLVQFLESIPTVQERFNFAHTFSADLAAHHVNPESAIRYIVGRDTLDPIGAEDWDAYEKMVALDFKMGLEERIPGNMIDTIDLYINAKDFLSPEQKEDAKILQSKFLTAMDEYVHLHELRGTVMTKNAANRLLDSDERVGILVMGNAHTAEAIDALHSYEDRLNYRIVGPKDSLDKIQTIRQHYEPLVRLISELDFE